MKNTMYALDKDVFARLYRNMTDDRDMVAVMRQMQARYPIHERKAYENADTMIRLVAAHGSFSEMLSEDAQTVLDNFITFSERMNGYDRKVLLHQLYFGLKLYQTPSLMEKMKEGVSVDQLYREYYAGCGEDPEITNAVLVKSIRELMGNFHLSPAAMRAIARKLEKEENMLATAAAIGQDGLRFKCIAAMDLYLRNQKSMTMEQAANIACTHVELEAVADGVSRGRITKERGYKLIGIIAITALVFSMAAWILAPQIMAVTGGVLTDAAWLVSNSANLPAAAQGAATAAAAIKAKVKSAELILLFSGFSLAAVRESVADWIGRIAAKRAFVHSNISRAAQALDDMADYVDAEVVTACEVPVIEEAALFSVEEEQAVQVLAC